MTAREKIDDFFKELVCADVVAPSGGGDQMVAKLLLLLPVGHVLRANTLKLGVLHHVLRSHPVQDEFRLIRHAHDVIWEERISRGGSDEVNIFNPGRKQQIDFQLHNN